jgi:hypothetical protein
MATFSPFSISMLILSTALNPPGYSKLTFFKDKKGITALP